MATLPSSVPPASDSNDKVVKIETHSHRKRKQKSKHGGGGEHSDSNWIVSYADMMTLLCVFFILMFTLANPDPEKMEKLKKETAQYFGGVYTLPYQELVSKLRQIVTEKNLDKQVIVESDESGVKITFAGAVFFESGKAELLAQGQDTLTKMVEIALEKASGFKVLVEGHTDDVPIVSSQFPSNWELSGARASRVIRLFESMGYDRTLLNAIGYADTRPVFPNRDDQGKPIAQNQAQNRRVVLRFINKDIGKWVGTQEKVN